ncbi:MAG: hypothetical protein KGL52_06140 [Rhodospirillales bacterium]|jgi:hypothetical protein|nr:hypothetical protein [Rhodospirillales bacterium]
MTRRDAPWSRDCPPHRGRLPLGASAGLALLALAGCAAAPAASATSHAGTPAPVYAQRQDVVRVSSVLNEKLDSMLAAQMQLPAR